MTPRLVTVCAALALAACQSPADIAAAHEQADRAECLRLGGTPDTPSYAECRDRLAQIRAAERKQRTIELMRTVQRAPLYTPAFLPSAR